VDGSLSTPRPFVTQFADGMTGDRAGGVWICDPRHGEVVRYDSAGRMTTRVAIDNGQPIACALADAEATLYIVGIERLAPGVNLFKAMTAGETRSALWRARLDEYRVE
jgi:sugar lactone lactonase YvrE